MKSLQFVIMYTFCYSYILVYRYFISLTIYYIVTQSYFPSIGTPRLADSSLTNQTYRICEGAELNMSVTFVSVPGPFMGWYDLPDTSRFIHNKDDRGNYRQVYFTTSYYIPTVYRYMFGTYLVQADNFRGPRAETYIQVVQDSSCSGMHILLFCISKPGLLQKKLLSNVSTTFAWIMITCKIKDNYILVNLHSFDFGDSEVKSMYYRPTHLQFTVCMSMCILVL